MTAAAEIIVWESNGGDRQTRRLSIETACASDVTLTRAANDVVERFMTDIVAGDVHDVKREVAPASQLQS